MLIISKRMAGWKREIENVQAEKCHFRSYKKQFLVRIWKFTFLNCISERSKKPPKKRFCRQHVVFGGLGNYAFFNWISERYKRQPKGSRTRTKFSRVGLVQ
ncbi:unnamed protein product [Ectocarpus sp. CCAP 1310/34]|nr:unnamed protein product [Ectocarpus sp. CCAP 1310/34]